MGHSVVDEEPRWKERIVKLIAETERDGGEHLPLSDFDLDTIEQMLDEPGLCTHEEAMLLLWRAMNMCRTVSHPPTARSARIPPVTSTSESKAANGEKEVKLFIGGIQVAAFKASRVDITVEPSAATKALDYLPGNAGTVLPCEGEITAPGPSQPIRKGCDMVYTIGADKGDPVYCTTHGCGPYDDEQCQKPDCPHCGERKKAG